MSLPHAILGLLEQQPMTGYDLKTLGFDRTVNHFWLADQAQIYRTLDKLAEQGFVTYQIEYQEDYPNRKVYTISESGRAELLRWLSTPQELPSIRQAFLIQLYFGENLPDETLINLIDHQIKGYEARLATFQQIAAGLPPLGDKTATRREVLHRLTVEKGIRSVRDALNWFNLCRETLLT